MKTKLALDQIAQQEHLNMVEREALKNENRNWQMQMEALAETRHQETLKVYVDTDAAQTAAELWKMHDAGTNLGTSGKETPQTSGVK